MNNILLRAHMYAISLILIKNMATEFAVAYQNSTALPCASLPFY